MCVYVADGAFLKAFYIRNQVISNNVGVLVYSGTSYSKMNIFRGLLHTKMVCISSFSMAVVHNC
jgi:hypothetical protein